MARYVLRRLISLAIVLVGISAVSFALGHLAPGDPAALVLERRQTQPATAEQLGEMRRELGLDDPVAVQYLRWAMGAARGDLGTSWGTERPVASLLKENLPRTMTLAVAALLMTVVLALPLGVLAARFHRSAGDNALRVGALLVASFPGFVIGYLLIYVFAARLGVLPAFGFGSPRHLLLPALTLALAIGTAVMRLTRAATLEALGESHVRAARAKGLSETRVLFSHGLRNALVPILTVLALRFADLLNGAVIVEWVFSRPGLGKLAIDGIYDRDYPLIQGFVLLAAALYVVMNFAADLAYAWADPRIRLPGQDRGASG